MLKIFNRDQQIVVSPSIVVFATLFLLFLYFLFMIRDILVLFFLGFIIMVALNPFVHKLESKLRLPQLIAIAITYLLLLVGIAAFFWILIPPLTTELYQLVKTFHIPWFQDELLNFSFNLSELSAVIESLGSSVGAIYSVITSTFSGIFTILTVLVMSLFLMLDRKQLHMRISWFTKDKRLLKAAKEFVDSLEHQLGGWVRGQIILMIIIGLVTYVGLILLGVPYAAPLALLAAALEILPNLGPTISAIPAIIIAYVWVGPVVGVATIVFYIMVQQLENNFIVPKIMKDNVDVSPLVSIMSILIGLKLAGVIGALLAIPIYIVIRTIYGAWFKDMILS